MQQLFQQLTETIVNKYSGGLKSAISEEIIQQLNVDPASFNDYLRRIKIPYQQYLSLKRSAAHANQEDRDNKNSLADSLKKCFKSVPSHFFNDSFAVQPSIFSRNIGKMNDIQQDYSLYLDEVEINLFYQINTRFNQFLTVILNLNSMQKSIDSSLYKITYLRNYTQNLRKQTQEQIK